MLQAIKNWFKKPLQKLEVKNTELCYDHNGIRLYKYNNPLELPTIRRLAMFEALHDAALGITSDDLKKYIEIVEEHINKGQYAKVAQTLSVLKFYVELHTNSKNLFNIAAPILFLEGEKENEYTTEIIEKKRKLYETDKDFKAFFLRMGYLYLTSLSNVKKTHTRIEDYLSSREVVLVEALFLRSITASTETPTVKV